MNSGLQCVERGWWNRDWNMIWSVGNTLNNIQTKIMGIYFVQNTVQFKTSLCGAWLNPGLHYAKRARINSRPSCVECGRFCIRNSEVRSDVVYGNALCEAPCLWIRNYVVRNVVELKPRQRSAIWLHLGSTGFIRVIFSPNLSVSLSSILYKFIFKLLWDNKLLMLWNIAMEPLILKYFITLWETASVFVELPTVQENVVGVLF